MSTVFLSTLFVLMIKKYKLRASKSNRFREPMGTVRGMNKMQAVGWEKPAMERTRSPHYKQRHVLVSFSKTRESLKQCVKIIARQIIQEKQKLRHLIISLLAFLLSFFNDTWYHRKRACIWSTTQISYIQCFDPDTFFPEERLNCSL